MNGGAFYDGKDCDEAKCLKYQEMHFLMHESHLCLEIPRDLLTCASQNWVTLQYTFCHAQKLIL